MEVKLREHIEELFSGAPESARAIELKEEMYRNLLDKYNGLLAEGKSSDAAYNITIMSIGNVDDLLNELKGGRQITPEQAASQKRSATLVSIAVMLYILSVVPVIAAALSGGSMLTGLIIMFVCLAVATGLIIFNSMTRPKYTKQGRDVVDDFREWQSDKEEKHSSLKAVRSAIWALITALYFIISFTTGAWHITWIIFLIGTAIMGIIKAVVSARDEKEDSKK